MIETSRSLEEGILGASSRDLIVPPSEEGQRSRLGSSASDFEYYGDDTHSSLPAWPNNNHSNQGSGVVRRHARRSLSLPASHTNLPSYHHHHHHAVVSESFALIDSYHASTTLQLASPDVTEAEPERAAAVLSPHAHNHHKTRPFLTSLHKSIEILGKNKARSVAGSVLEHVRIIQPSSAKTLLNTVVHLAAYSILGASLRVFLGRLFGNECSNPETAWLHAVVTKANLCVTSSSEAAAAAADDNVAISLLLSTMPANMVGSFMMGLLQPSQDLELLNSMPVAFLNSQHWFQSWSVHHLGLRTGFCSSLTTFAAWNTQMVRLLDGSTITANHGSELLSALLGYIMQLELALASLIVGQNVAIWLHRYTNKGLAKEEDMMTFAFSRTSVVDGGNIIRTPLPDYERIYLANLLPHEEHEWAKKNVTALQDLEKWKVSTDAYRTTAAGHNDDDDFDGEHNNNNELLLALHEIERKVLVDQESVGDEWREIAQREGWDLEALQRFAKEASSGASASAAVPSNDNQVPSTSAAVCRFLLASLPFVLSAVLIAAFAVLAATTKNDEADFYRANGLSVLLAPLGTLVRWKLSSLNGRLSGRWVWFPLGTFTANIVASLIAAVIAGLMDSSSRSLTANTAVWLTAISWGFVGSMSTVSTFAVEGFLLQKSYPHHAKAYYYTVGTLMVAGTLGVAIYAPLVRSGPDSES